MLFYLGTLLTAKNELFYKLNLFFACRHIQRRLTELSKIEKLVCYLTPWASGIVKFLIHDWFVRQTTNTKGKECGLILSSRLWGGAFRDDTKNGCVADCIS